MRLSMYRQLPAMAVVGLAFTLALSKIGDPDFWWHLKCGELFVRDGIILRKDIFSYTAAGSPWVNGYIPAQAVIYLAWAAGGAGGVCLPGR